MSTKKLKRSVYEQGRGRSYGQDNKFINKALRAQERAYLADIKKNPDVCDEMAEPVRDDNWHWHGSKLTPVFRWLASQEGRPWDDVYSELCQKVSINDEAFRWLQYRIVKFGDFNYDQVVEGTRFYARDFYVDQEGIFHKVKKIPREKQPPCKFSKPEVADWLNGRIVGRVGRKLYWFYIVSSSSWGDETKCAWNSPWYYPKKTKSYNYYYYDYGRLVYVKKEYRDVYKDGKVVGKEESWQAYYGKPAARQYNELTKEDLEFWNQLTKSMQSEILAWSPTSDENPAKSRYGYYW